MSLPFRLMGVVNVTPDSFSDGGLFLDPGAAVAHGLELVGEGAEIVDVGGESTRPGAQPVSEVQELRRVLPVVEGLAAALKRPPAGSGGGDPVTVSIDTSKAFVARAALDAGATLVNDVTALRGDPEMASVVAHSGAECCLMHMLGEPRTMQREPRYGDVVADVKAFLEERLAFAVSEGVAEERILLDPGIGFGKTLEHNLQLLRRLHELTTLGRPLVVGTSRKSFIGRILADAAEARATTDATGRPAEDRRPPGAGGEESSAGARELAEVTDRLPGTLATCVLAYERGASVLRVHDVAPVRAALEVAAATLGAL
ncbi:MAG TPA: dihydropteroate synthase [Solirubrobacteraceae bacterium]|jgi:dihydropteroate synthase|nr:dihydropteroate synthase [Solirubrobacteraceae bacterium]